MLETYNIGKSGFDSGLHTAMPGPEQVWAQQERLYRIEVLEACQMFVKSAPNSAETKELFWHYQMLDAYIQSLTQERRYGAIADDNLQKQRDTAHGNLMKVVQDYRKRFGSFCAGNDAGCYKKTITSVIQTVLSAWIQYRQTYIEIAKENA
jgi:hypothetical protein